MTLLALAPAAEADFGIETFSARTTDATEAPYTDAGGHPYESTIEFSIGGGEDINGLYLGPVPGFIANPAAASRCQDNALLSAQCPPGSLVGLVDISRIGKTTTYPLYNLVPERGYPAQFGFKVAGVPTRLSVLPRPRTEFYGLTLAIPNNSSGTELTSLSARLCGFGLAGEGTEPDPYKCQLPSASTGAPFLSNPLDCSLDEPTASIAIDSQEHADALRELGIPDLIDPDWKTAAFIVPAPTGCDRPPLTEQFAPTISTEPLQHSAGAPLQTDQPSGLRVGFEFPQSNDPTDPDAEFNPKVPQAPPPKEITVKLPAGLAISPSSADGLGACSDQASDPAGDQVHYDTTKPVRCPNASKIGSATATSPLLATRDPLTGVVDGAEPMLGGVYVLKPHPGDLAGDQDAVFRLVIQLENAERGVNIKLPGIATADKQTGRLTLHVTATPQLPVKHLTVNLTSGPRAALMTPVTCGRYETTTTFVPWSTPGTPDAHPSAGFEVGSSPNGTGCVAAPGQRPFSPDLLAAGTVNDHAGASTPFVLQLNRADGERELSSLEATLPKGLAAKLTGIPDCPDAALAAAAARTGEAEQATPSCPASRIGSVKVDAGPGSNPFQVRGTAYLAGPYKGAPLSVAFITPALSGAFDLGNLVFRAAAYVDPSTAQVTVRTDPLPQILDGIPLRLRSIALTLDRPAFTRNPTSCEPMALSATAAPESGPSVALSKYFQAGGCADLSFRPRLSVRLSRAMARNGRPALWAEITAKPGQANIARAELTLPATELLDYDHIRGVCTKSRYAAGAGGGEACAPASRYGRARLFTPLLDKPLEGPLYLRTNGNPRELPDLVASLGGEIHLDLAAHVSSAHGLLRVVFDGVPDVPVERVVLRLHGGQRGLLVNTTDLCPAGARTSALFLAHNGKRHASRRTVNLSCNGRGRAGTPPPGSTSIRGWGEPSKSLLG